MKEFLDLNKKLLIQSYLWFSGILTVGFTVFLFFFHSEVPFFWIITIYSITLLILPLIGLGTWTIDWHRKRKYKNRILSKKPYSELLEIGFNMKTIKPNHNSLVDFVTVAEINDCEIVFDIDISKPKVAEFHIYGLTNHLSSAEFSKKFKELKLKKIEISYYGFTKRIDTKKEKITSIKELKSILSEYTQIAKQIKYEPIPIEEKTPVANIM